MTDHDTTDAFIFALGTFSNGPALPPLAMADVARAAYETNTFVFRSRSRWWFQDSGWRKWCELSEAQQEQALASFRKPPPLLDPGVDSGVSNYSYTALYGRVRSTYVIAGLGAVEIAGAPYGRPPYKQCAACGTAKRTRERQRRPYCSACSC